MLLRLWPIAGARLQLPLLTAVATLLLPHLVVMVDAVCSQTFVATRAADVVARRLLLFMPQWPIAVADRRLLKFQVVDAMLLFLKVKDLIAVLAENSPCWIAYAEIVFHEHEKGL